MNSEMKINEITIIIDFKIYFYLFEPIIRYLSEKGLTIYLAVPLDLKHDIEASLKDIDVRFINYEDIKQKNKWRYILHRTCSLLFTRMDFSYQFMKKRKQVTKKFGGVQGFLLKIAPFFPKVPNKSINRFLHTVSGVGLENPFPTRIVMVGSLNASAEILTAKNLKVITVMESWDHAVKEPNGYVSDVFFGWNKSLCEDWSRVQGDKDCRVFHPAKLRYSHEKINWVRDKNQSFRLMYPVAGTAKFSIPVLVDIERKLISELVEITRKLGWELYIKPRPNGLDGEFDGFAKHGHVEVGPVSHGDIDNPANYYYSDKNNKERFSVLNNVDLVLNAFTTYGLDAASANVPVLQLDLREAIGYEKSYMVYNNYHIKRYLISSRNTLKPKNRTLESSLIENADSIANRANEYTQEMNEWLFHYESCENAIDSCFGGLIVKGL